MYKYTYNNDCYKIEICFTAKFRSIQRINCTSQTSAALVLKSKFMLSTTSMKLSGIEQSITLFYPNKMSDTTNTKYARELQVYVLP